MYFEFFIHLSFNSPNSKVTSTLLFTFHIWVNGGSSSLDALKVLSLQFCHLPIHTTVGHLFFIYSHQGQFEVQCLAQGHFYT